MDRGAWWLYGPLGRKESDTTEWLNNKYQPRVVGEALGVSLLEWWNIYRIKLLMPHIFSKQTPSGSLARKKTTKFNEPPHQWHIQNLTHRNGPRVFLPSSSRREMASVGKSGGNWWFSCAWLVLHRRPSMLARESQQNPKLVALDLQHDSRWMMVLLWLLYSATASLGQTSSPALLF